MASSDHVIKVRTELDNLVVVRPGDKLVIGRTDRISPADIVRLKARIAELLPGVEPVIISECSGLAVYRDEPAGIRHLNRELTEDEVKALRERGVIDEDGKSAGDRIAEYFARNIKVDGSFPGSA